STFFCTKTDTSDIYILSLHDALPISRAGVHQLPEVLDIARVVANQPLREMIDHLRGGVIRSARERLPDPVDSFIRQDLHEHDVRSEEHTSELQSRFDLVCRLLLEKKK